MVERSSVLPKISALEELITEQRRVEIERLRDEQARHSAVFTRLQRVAARVQDELRVRADCLERLEQAVGERDARIGALEQALSERGVRITQLQRELHTYAAVVATAESQVADRDRRLAAVYRSTSWRLMRPVRAVLRLIRGQIGIGDVVRQLRLSARVRLSQPRPQQPVWEVPAPPAAQAGAAEFPTTEAPAEPVPVAPRVSQPLRFPLRDRIAVLPEVTGTEAAFVDVAVSVVIPTYNAGAELGWLLRKLRNQKGLRSVEIVVVDSGSTDGTDELARRLGAKLVGISKEEFSHSYSRNLGAEAASGDLLLFTVQDAYPIGDYWLATLAAALLSPAPDGSQLAAISCAEFPRSDSEILYNALIDTHYKFLGCAEADRIGSMSGSDNMSLRTQGQLSDVACLIGREFFLRYRYEGRYAEDLLLGIRLIRDGHKVGMLSSVKVIHSHNRPTSYYVRRVFVDVVFLKDVFPDFGIPAASSVRGSLAMADALYRHMEKLSWAHTDVEPAELLRTLAADVRHIPVPSRSSESQDGVIDFGFAPLGAWISRSFSGGQQRLDAQGRQDAEQVREMFASRVENVQAYVSAVFKRSDAEIALQLKDAAFKTLAMTVGAQLGFIYLNAESDSQQPLDPALAELKPMLMAGI
jgi:glycosyltransferase involved in cell wall biosynthesis